MIVVAIIAILAAIAIPAYQNYLIRTQVTEGMNLATGAKVAVWDFVSNTGRFPSNNESAGLTQASSITGSYVTQVDVAGGKVTAKFGNKPGRLMCSYFTHFADNKTQEDAQRARQIRYYKECVIPAFPGDPKTAPPSYRYFIDMVERLQKVKPEDLTENSVLIGSPARICETLKKVEAAGFAEVILYFNVGLKPHAQVKDEMARFMEQVAPQFDGQHKQRAA